MKNVSRQLRQGDVLIHPVASLPEGARKVKAKGRLVLAEGEATGHHHSIAVSGRFTSYRVGGDTYLDVREPVELEHQEHAALVLQPGVYQVRRQLEYWHDEVRRVAD